jgi:hypothetical protein
MTHDRIHVQQPAHHVDRWSVGERVWYREHGGSGSR